MEADPVIASETGVTDPSSAAEKKPSEAVKETTNGETRQNGTTEKRPEDVPLPSSPVENEGAVASPAAAALDGPQQSECVEKQPEVAVDGGSEGDVKSVSLNNENDDRVDSIEVVGQGDAAAAGGTSNSSASSVDNLNNCTAAVSNDLQDVEQSPTSKASDPEATPVVVEATQEKITTTDDAAVGQVADNQVIVTENGQGVEGDRLISTPADENEAKKETSSLTDLEKPNEEGPVAPMADDEVTEDEPTLVVGDVRSVNDEALPEEPPEEGSDKPKEEMESLQLDDSQEEVELEEEEVKVKQEIVSKSPQANEIETIDIDTDDDDEEDGEEDASDEESLVGPPIDDEDEMGEEGDFDDAEEEVESVDGYEEFEVSDEENLSQEMVDGREGEPSDEDEVRFATMKASQRGAKRKLSEDRDSGSKGDLKESATKERRVSWLDSGNSPRMHGGMESGCREAMLRHNSDKIEEIPSQDEEDEEEDDDEEEEATDSDVVVELKGNTDATATTTTVQPVNVLQQRPSTTAPSVVTDKGNAPESVKSSAANDSESTLAKVADSESSVAEAEEVVVKVAGDEKQQEEEKKKEKGEGQVEHLVSKDNAGVAESNGDCDKIKSGAKGADATDEIMDLDSRDSESVAEQDLPKESDAVKQAEKGASDVVVEKQENATENKVQEEEEEEVGGTPMTVENGSASHQSENLLKRKRDATSTDEKSLDNAPVQEGQREPQQDKATAKPASSSASTELPRVEEEEAAEKGSPTAKKAKLSETASEQLQRELQENFGRHDKLLREYLLKSAEESTEGVQKHVEQLVMEIEALSDMIRTKEMEWNNLIHLKKVKEELVMRLTRKKHVQDIQAAPLEKTFAVAQALISQPEEGLFSAVNNSRAAAQANKLIKNLQMSSSLGGAAANSKTTQSILQNRANMTKEDLEKEKKNTAKLHRHSIQGSMSSISAASSTSVGGGTASTVAASSVGPNRRNSMSPAPNALSGRASAPAVGVGRSRTPTSTPIHGMGSGNSNDTLEQRMTAFERLATVQALQNQELLQHQFFQQQQYEAAMAHSAASMAAAAAAGQVVGRQGPIKDVRSIIEDYRQKHPESVPRRGRLQQSHQSQVHHHQQQQQQQHHQLQQQHAAAVAAQQQSLQGSGNSLLHGILTKQLSQQAQTVRALQQQQQQVAQQQQQLQQQGAANGGVAGSGFSPTLARLLTAPERISTVQNVANYQQQQQQQQQPVQNPVINLSKNLKSEITITPVVSQNNSNSNQFNNMMLSMPEDDQDDNSADRLVIDEGQEFHENEVPECQGCKRKEAQFVCAGCGNQWYCSRECQVSAWDEHSETCTG